MLVGCLLVFWSELYHLYVGRLACLVSLVGLVYLVGLVDWSSLTVNRLDYCSVCWHVGELTIVVAHWRFGS